MADTNAPNAAECQSFLDNLIAQFGTFESGNDPMESMPLVVCRKWRGNARRDAS